MWAISGLGCFTLKFPSLCMDWAFAECFSHGKKSKLLGSHSPALKRFPELVHLGCKAWGADLFLQKCTSLSLLKSLWVCLNGGFGLFRLQVITIDCWATCEIEEVEFSLHLFSAVQSQSNSTDFVGLEEALFWCYIGRRSVPGRQRWWISYWVFN